MVWRPLLRGKLVLILRSVFLGTDTVALCCSWWVYNSISISLLSHKLTFPVPLGHIAFYFLALMNVGGIAATCLTFSAVLTPESHTSPIRDPLLTVVSYLFVLWKIALISIMLFSIFYELFSGYTTDTRNVYGINSSSWGPPFCNNSVFQFLLQHDYCKKKVSNSL